MNRNHLIEIFGAYGNLKAVEIAEDKETKLSKGYAFLEYQNKEAAEKACLYMSGGQVDGQVIKIEQLNTNLNKEKEKEASNSDSNNKSSNVNESKPPALNKSSNTKDDYYQKDEKILGKKTRRSSRSRSKKSRSLSNNNLNKKTQKKTEMNRSKSRSRRRKYKNKESSSSSSSDSSSESSSSSRSSS